MKNTNNNTDGPEVFTFGGNEQLLFQFEELLRTQKGIPTIPPDLNLGKASYAVMDMLESFKKGGQDHDKTKDYRPEWRQAAALGDLLRKILHASKQPHFEQLWPHIHLLLGDTNIAQNVNSLITDSDANKLFELYMALVLSPISAGLELDDPVKSSGGRNPDIIADINGVRWAFACKVLHTKSPETFIGNVRKAVEQIDRSNADKGIVVISLKNVIPHDDFWPITKEPGSGDIIYGCWPHPDSAAVQLDQIRQRYHDEVIGQILGPDGFEQIFSENQKVPAEPVVLLHLSTMIVLDTGFTRIHTLLKAFGALASGPLSPEVNSLLDHLNSSLHDRSLDFSTFAPAA